MIENKIDTEILNELLFNSKIGLAIYSIDFENSIFENENFTKFFPLDKDKGLTKRIRKLNVERILKRTANNKEYVVEHELIGTVRKQVVKLYFSQTPSSTLLVKAIDYTKEKELEYLLDSYVKMAEDNKKQLEQSLEIIKNQKAELSVAYDNLERERNSIELRALQAIINPHFVSNCLGSIQNFIMHNNTEMSINYLSHFGKIMRMSFEQSYYDYVSIDEIIDILETYVSIEKIRIEHDWDFVLDIDKNIDVENSKIPPLLIQPFLENSIWHGIHNKTEGGKITIKFILVNEMTVKCIIEDNGSGRVEDDFNHDKLKTRLHSLNVTQRRLDILWKEFDENHQITFTDLKTESGEPCGTAVELYIPLNF